MANFQINTITGKDSKRGTSFVGVTTVSSTGSMRIPSGPTENRGGRGRGVVGGTYPAPSKFINYIEIATTGNATAFGDLANVHGWSAATASSTRCVWSGGYTTGGGLTSKIDAVTISSGGGGYNFGDLKTTVKQMAGFSDSTRGIIPSGRTPGSGQTTQIQYITIATAGDSNDFGDTTAARGGGKGTASPTRGVYALGGYWAATDGTPGNAANNSIDYVTIQSKGDAKDFGDMSVGYGYNGAAAASTTRGILAGGYTAPANTNAIDYLTIATTGNAADFGDLTVARHGGAGMSNKTRAAFTGMWDNAADDTIDYVTIATTGNAADFGNLTTTGFYMDGGSDSHGGLG